jgi:hypothetical protein
MNPAIERIGDLAKKILAILTPASMTVAIYRLIHDQTIDLAALFTIVGVFCIVWWIKSKKEVCGGNENGNRDTSQDKAENK